MCAAAGGEASSCRASLNMNLPHCIERLRRGSAWWQLPAVWCLSVSRSHYLAPLRRLIDLWDNKSGHRPHGTQSVEHNWTEQGSHSRWSGAVAVVVHRSVTNKSISLSYLLRDGRLRVVNPRRFRLWCIYFRERRRGSNGKQNRTQRVLKRLLDTICSFQIGAAEPRPLPTLCFLCAPVIRDRRACFTMWWPVIMLKAANLPGVALHFIPCQRKSKWVDVQE